MLFEAGVHVGSICAPQLFDFVGVVLKCKPTVISVLLAFMLVSSCVALFACVLEPRPTQAGDLPASHVGIGVGVCFGVGVSARNCACVGIGVAISVIVGVDVCGATDLFVGGGVTVIWVPSLLSASMMGLGVGVALRLAWRRYLRC